MQIEIEKLKEVENPKHPNNIQEGYKRSGDFVRKPILGERFWVGRNWSTSVVTEIIDDHTFRTLNSIYTFRYIPNRRKT